MISIIKFEIQSHKRKKPSIQNFGRRQREDGPKVKKHGPCLLQYTDLQSIFPSEHCVWFPGIVSVTIQASPWDRHSVSKRDATAPAPGRTGQENATSTESAHVIHPTFKSINLNTSNVRKWLRSLLEYFSILKTYTSSSHVQKVCGLSILSLETAFGASWSFLDEAKVFHIHCG